MESYNRNKYIFGCFIAAILAVSMAGCKSNDDYVVKNIIKEGERIYLTKPDSVAVYSGRNRVKLSWVVTNHSGTTTKIYWKNKSDSVEIPLTKISQGKDTISTIINNLEEGSYTFDIINVDESGNTSIPVLANSTVYGNTYSNSLTNRAIQSVLFKDGKYFVNWGTPNTDCIYTVLRYKNQTGQINSVFVPSDSTTTMLEHMDPTDSIFHYYTLYSPPSSIDTFYTDTTNLNFLPILIYVNFDKSNWKIVDVNTLGIFVAANLIDGNEGSLWASNFSNPDPLPHYFSIDMAQSHIIHGFEIVVRPIIPAQKPKEVTIQFSNDGQTWGDSQDLTLPFTDPTTIVDAKVNLLYPVNARYFKFIIRTNVGAGVVVTAITEIYAF